MRIAVFNQKGGVGKTTTALNIAAVLSRRDQRPLLIDLDPQAHLSAIHGSAPTAAGSTVFALYLENRPLAELAIEWPSLGQLIPAHTELIKVDSVFGKGPSILNRLNQGLHAMPITEAAAPVIIDCCPFLGVLSLNAIFAAERLLVPVSSDFLSMRGALQIERTLKALEPVLKRRMERRYLLTRFDRRRKMCFEILARMRDQFGGDVCETTISENVSVAEAPAVNKDVLSHAPNSKGAQDYAMLVEELAAAGWL